jgi:hypothetical protein
VSQLPVELRPPLAARLRRAFDLEATIARGLDALGPLADRDVVIIDAEGSPVVDELQQRQARVVPAPAGQPLRLPGSDASADAIVGLWSSFRGPDPSEITEVDRVLRPGGRHLVVHDYGRDDVARLLPADRPEYGPWSQRTGPFLRGGFRLRVLHCWWTFESLDDAAAFLIEAFPERGPEVARSLRRPRLAYNVAVYHRSRGDAPSGRAGACA